MSLWSPASLSILAFTADTSRRRAISSSVCLYGRSDTRPHAIRTAAASRTGIVRSASSAVTDASSGGTAPAPVLVRARLPARVGARGCVQACAARCVRAQARITAGANSISRGRAEVRASIQFATAFFSVAGSTTVGALQFVQVYTGHKCPSMNSTPLLDASDPQREQGTYISIRYPQGGGGLLTIGIRGHELFY